MLSPPLPNPTHVTAVACYTYVLRLGSQILQVQVYTGFTSSRTVRKRACGRYTYIEVYIKIRAIRTSTTRARHDETNKRTTKARTIYWQFAKEKEEAPANNPAFVGASTADAICSSSENKLRAQEASARELDITCERAVTSPGEALLRVAHEPLPISPNCSLSMHARS